MCRELDALRQSITAFAAGFDARALMVSEAAEVVKVCAAIEASVASVKALAAARAAHGDAWRQQGYRSPADQLAREAGMSPAAAKRALETGRRLAGQPQVAQAALAGELTLEQAEAVSDGAAANPARTADLIERARRASLPELNEEVARVKAAATDQEARRAARHDRRSLRRWTDRDGALQAHLYGHPEDGARLWQALDPIRRHLIMSRRQAGGGNEPLDSLDYDALMALAGAATGQGGGGLGITDLVELGLFPNLEPRAAAPAAPGHAGAPGRPTPPEGGQLYLAGCLQLPSGPQPPPPAGAPDQEGAPGPARGQSPPGGDQAAPEEAEAKPRRAKKLAGSPIRIMIRVDLDTLLRGVPLDGELCEIPGYGSVPVSVIDELAANGNTFIVGVLTKGQQLIGVYHHRKRHPNRHQKSGLDFVYPTCAAAGCNARDGLQYDHRIDYAKTHYTAFDLIDRLCPHHHRLKTDHGWALTPGRGKRPFVPPHDPRHPDHPDPAGPDPP